MDKIEKIRKKIEELLNDWKYGSSTEAKYRCEVYKELLEDIESIQEEPVSEDLEEAARKHCNKQQWPNDGFDELDKKSCIYDFKSGANWQKECMMKDAVNGYVIEDIEEGNGDFLLSADYLPASMGLKDRQKVKVIVLKDE